MHRPSPSIDYDAMLVYQSATLTYYDLTFAPSCGQEPGVSARCSWCCTFDHTVSATEFVQYKAPVDPAKRHDGLPPDDASFSDQPKCT